MGGEPNIIVGIEGGATRTAALLADNRGRIHRRVELAPLNIKLASDRQILGVLRQFKPARAAICLAGCRTEADRRRLSELARRTWPKAQSVFVGSDLDSGHAAAFGSNATGILVISGTGSCVFGRNARGDIARVGGWGHLLGDAGSGYWIALSNLRSLISIYDRTGQPYRALQKVLRHLCLNSPEQLVDWIQSATKSEIAALAPVVFDADPALLSEAADVFASDCATVAKTLRLAAPDIALAGGVFAHQPKFFKLTARKIQKLLPRAIVRHPKLESANGAVLLALECGDLSPLCRSIPEQRRSRARGSALQITEQRHPRTMDLHKRSVAALIDTMLDEEARVVPALRQNRAAVQRAVNAVVTALRRGGRLFYVGAGTSGRLGVLDASECPPTFSTDPEMVQGVIAGGATALHTSVEAAEDDPVAGAEAIRHRGVGRRDVVVGISASGSTPFVSGALDEAKKRGARTFLLCFSPPRTKRHARLLFHTGPEVVAGSTRLKAGTATKIALNILTTVSMIRLGKVVSNLMVDVKPTNEKLRDRACRIVATLGKCDDAEARRWLERSNWNVKRALAVR